MQQAKKIEQQAKKAELQAKRAEQQAKKARQAKKQKGEGSSGECCTSRKRKLPEGPLKTYPKRKRVEGASIAVRQESVQDTCYVCTGLYSDNLDGSGCVLDGQ